MTMPPAADRPRITLEDYVLFFTTRTGRDLTIDQLNQIIFLHGFKKFHRSNKTAILDALNSFELLRPRRATVSINAFAPPPGAAGPAAAVLSTEAVRRDIEDLGWRECPVGSVLSIHAGAVDGDSFPVPLATLPPGSAAVQSVSPPTTLSASSGLTPAPPGVAAKRNLLAPRGKGKTVTKRKEKRMRELLTLPSIEVDDVSRSAAA